jgi:hypothetical protein
MFGSSLSRQLTPLQAFLLLGLLTIVAFYIGPMIIGIFLSFIFHGSNPITIDSVIDEIPGNLIVAMLNMFLWVLFVILPRRSRKWSGGLAGLCCGLIAPSIMSIVDTFFGLVRHGYFLGKMGPSTNLGQLAWPLTFGPLMSTIFIGWFTVLVCITLDVLLVHWLDARFHGWNAGYQE